MNDQTPEQYEEIIMCEPSKDEGLVFMKIVATPYGDPVEFNVAEARIFAEKILAAVKEVESGWVGGSASEGREA